MTNIAGTITGADLINGQWRSIDGDRLVSVNPARPAHAVWIGSPHVNHVREAVTSAHEARPQWAAWPAERRFAVLRRYAEIATERADQMASLISDETGKALWDTRGEAALLAGKVAITLDQGEHGALARVAPHEVSMTDTRAGRTNFRPHGVMAVIGPFNFPAHLPNGHIVPALAMGNTVVFKPSDKAPATGELLAAWFKEALDEADAPTGVINLVHGGADVASNLTADHAVDGILFTGSWPVGRRILEANLDRPSRMIALEMGGNNPAVIMPDADLRQAVIECVRCAFITTGQRCTCTRRIIVHEDVADRFTPAFCKAASALVVGDPKADHPVFMGPIISAQARDAVLQFQADLAAAGGEVLVESTAPESPENGYYVTPSVVRVDRFNDHDGSPRDDGVAAGVGGTGGSGGGGGDPGCDMEVFGPLTRICTVSSLDDAIEQANATRFGLAASIFTRDPGAIERFQIESRAGCININTGTAGASGKLPFGGLGLSGNNRPAGAFSLDYCAYPVAGLIEAGNAATTSPGMHIDDAWLQ